MTAFDIEVQLLDTLTALQEAYRIQNATRHAWEIHLAKTEYQEHEIYLKEKALRQESQETLKRLARMGVQDATLEGIRLQTLYREALAQVSILERRLDALRSLLGIERVKIEKHVELGE